MVIIKSNIHGATSASITVMSNPKRLFEVAFAISVDFKIHPTDSLSESQGYFFRYTKFKAMQLSVSVASMQSASTIYSQGSTRVYPNYWQHPRSLIWRIKLATELRNVLQFGFNPTLP